MSPISLASEKQKYCPFTRHKNIAGRFFGLSTKHACDRRTDGQTELRLPRPR